MFLVVLGFAVLSALTLILIRRLYEKRRVFQHIYTCEIRYKQRALSLLGYMDSGNLASKNGLPVCFLSPDVFYELFGEEILYENGLKNQECGGQVCYEMVITTMSGERKVRLFRAELSLQISSAEIRKTEVYFTPSKHIINREYQLLLNASIIKG